MTRFAFILLATLMMLAPRAATAEPAHWNDLHELIAQAEPVAGSPARPAPAGGPVIVTFFASWCPPCTDEFGHLNSLAQSVVLGDTSIIGINLFENFGGKPDPARMARFIRNTAPDFPLLTGTEAMRIAFGDIDRIPTVVIYDDTGKEHWRFVHIRDAEKTHVTYDELVAVLENMR